MSWVMADRVGQSEHHYSAAAPPHPARIISAQQQDTLLNYSVYLLGSGGKAAEGCGVKTECRDLHVGT